VVGESFVVMFEEQFAPMRRENTIPRRRAQLVSFLTPRHGRLRHTFARGRGTTHDTRPESTRARSAATAMSCPLGHPVAELPLNILMRGDGPSARWAPLIAWRLTSTDESRNQWQEDFIMSLTISSDGPTLLAT
jgi:hypothetical protein